MKVELIFKDAWNTGRQYSGHGQRIAVYEVVVDGEVKALFMCDLDRSLEYYFDLPYSMVELRNHVMTRYDQNEALGHDWWWQYADEMQARRDARSRKFPTWRV